MFACPPLATGLDEFLSLAPPWVTTPTEVLASYHVMCLEKLEKALALTLDVHEALTLDVELPDAAQNCLYQK